MARRPRSRASRAERRLLKERAASEIKHGLPVPTQATARARVPDVASLRGPGTSSEPPSMRSGGSSSRRMPLAVKLLGIGLLLLGVTYALTLIRDHHRETDAAAAPAETDTAPNVPAPTSSSAASPPVAARAVASDEPELPATSKVSIASASASPTRESTPLAAAIRVPSVRPPQPALVPTQPTAPTPIDRKKAVMAQPSAALGNAPAAAAPAAKAPAPPKVDNPY